MGSVMDSFKLPSYPSGLVLQTCLALINSSQELGFANGSLTLRALLHNALMSLLQEAFEPLDGSLSIWCRETAQCLFNIEYLRSIASICQQGSSGEASDVVASMDRVLMQLKANVCLS